MSGAQRRLTPKQAAVLAFIRDEVAAHRGFPTHRAIADHMGWKCETSSRDACMRLVIMGALVIAGEQRRGRARVRRFKLVEDYGDGGELRDVPVLEPGCPASGGREVPAPGARPQPEPIRQQRRPVAHDVLGAVVRGVERGGARCEPPRPIPATTARPMNFDDARTYLEALEKAPIPWIIRGATLRYRGRAWTMRQLVEEARRLMALPRAVVAPAIAWRPAHPPDRVGQGSGGDSRGVQKRVAAAAAGE